MERDLVAQREAEEEVAETISEAGGGHGGNVWVGLPSLRVGAGWEPCVHFDWVERDPGDDVDGERDAAWETVNELYEQTPSLEGYEVETCPLDDAEGLPVALVHDLVRAPVIDELPRPEPTVPPGYAITGMPAYLVTHHDLTYQRDQPLTVEFQGTELRVEVSGRASMYVDWDDGHGPVRYDEPGLPYPHGQVRRAYADRGEAQLSVIDEWSLDYVVRADGQVIIEDQVPAFSLPPVTHDLEIREYRAVRVSPESIR